MLKAEYIVYLCIYISISWVCKKTNSETFKTWSMNARFNT